MMNKKIGLNNPNSCPKTTEATNFYCQKKTNSVPQREKQ